MPMNPFTSYLFSLMEESISLARSLQEVLIQERAALITLNTDEILVLVTQKESRLMKLVRKRAEIKKFIRIQFNQENLEDLKLTDENLQREWESKKKIWVEVWSELRDVCENNQRFISHSMKNMDRLVENLKRLLGQHATYSPKGKRIEQNNQGRVVQGRY